MKTYSNEDVRLRQGDRYEILSSGDRGYLFTSNDIDVPGDKDKTLEDVLSAAIAREFNLEISPIELNASLILNHITFASNSAELTPSSLLELDRVTDFLVHNPEVEIEVSAHTDDVGSDEFNEQLSERRANSVKQYLIKNNIPEGSLSSVGFGESRPLVANNSEENRRRNRRVELRVTKIN